MKTEMLKNIALFYFCLLILAAPVQAQTAAPVKKDESAAPPAARKTNRRPAAAAPSEPFENATVEMLAKQCVKLETEAGAIELEMFPESAPATVRNFLNLARLKAFDTTTFSRIVPNFVVQGGNVATRLKYTDALVARMQRAVPDEPNGIRHERGIVSLARSSAPNTGTSNFFILLRDSPHLDGTFAAFGRVTSGLEIVEAINKMPVAGEKPEKPVRLNRALVFPCVLPAAVEAPK